LFRIALAESIRNWDRDEKIGDVFVASFSKAIVLDIYSGFINNFSVAMDLAKMEAKRKSALADFLKVTLILKIVVDIAIAGCYVYSWFTYVLIFVHSVTITVDLLENFYVTVMWFLIAGETDQCARSLVFLWTYGKACAEVPAVHFVPAG
jgi:hypothetical protein